MCWMVNASCVSFKLTKVVQNMCLYQGIKLLIRDIRSRFYHILNVNGDFINVQRTILTAPDASKPITPFYGRSLSRSSSNLRRAKATRTSLEQSTRSGLSWAVWAIWINKSMNWLDVIARAGTCFWVKIMWSPWYHGSPSTMSFCVENAVLIDLTISSGQSYTEYAVFP